MAVLGFEVRDYIARHARLGGDCREFESANPLPNVFELRYLELCNSSLAYPLAYP